MSDESRIYRTEVARVIEAGQLRGLTPTEGIALHEALGYAAALECIAQFGGAASPSAARVYAERARVMAKDAPRLAGGNDGTASTTAQAGAAGAEPPLAAAAIYARRAVQTSGG
jgi:hypothetical protein